MPTLETVRLDEGLFTMFKGEPGTRKSTCALSYPLPQYWFSSDQKMGSMNLPAKRWGVDLSKIQFDDYKDWTKVDQKLTEFQVNCPFKTVIIDSITSLADNVNRETIGFKRGTKTTEGKDKGNKVGNIYVNTMEDYKAEAAALGDLIAKLKDIQKYHKIHIIVIAHVVASKKDKQENDLTHHARTIITGGEKISGKFPAYCEEVYHFNIGAGFKPGEGTYEMFTTHTGNDFARTSLPLPRMVTFNDEPLFEKFIQPAIIKQQNEKPIVRF